MRIIGLLFLTACAGDPTWMAHPCGNGDPVSAECEGDDKVLDEPSVALCSDLAVSDGDECDTVDDRCVIDQGFTCTSTSGRSSEAFLHCRTGEWTEEDGMCPQSSRSVKTGISYVDDAERQALSKQVLDVKLARYEYTLPNKHGKKLGYILEDSPQAVFSGDGRVDMYAYLSALVATTQAQQAQIDALQAEVTQLKSELAPTAAGN